METNEAPEKLWINPSIDLPKLNGVMDKHSIQYVRADVFIEKACEWIKELMIASDNYDAYDIQENLRDFKQTMRKEE